MGTIDLELSESSGNVYADLGFAPEVAANLMLRSTLMVRITKIIRKNGLTQQLAAQQFGVTQPRINQLLKGKIDAFSLDALVNMLGRAGYEVRPIIVEKKDAIFG